MQRLLEGMRDLRGALSARLVLGLGMAASWLVLIAIIGLISVSDDDGEVAAGGFQGGGFIEDDGFGDAVGPGDPDAIDGEDVGIGADGTAPDGSRVAGRQSTSGRRSGGSTGSTTGATSGGSGGSGGGSSGGGSSGGGGGGTGDRRGIDASSFRFGVHAPMTFDGVPLNLAEDPIHGLEGYAQWLNEQGGVNGRTINMKIVDDSFTTEGAKRAADALIHDFGAFFVSGTLGIDQINVVSNEAAKAGTPYMAGGGYEAAFNGRMFQIISSYDTHVLQLADFMATQDRYRGKRVGIISSNSEYIIPVAERFQAALKAHGSDSIIKTINKPQDESNYTQKVILPFKEFEAEVVVPLTDPISTSRIVAECEGQLCDWTYSFSNFAHDTDTALTLMAGKWGELGVRGLSGACYYQAPEVEDAGRCAQMKAARDRYIEVYDQEDWNTNGSGGATGYQIIWFWLKAMKDIGTDPTRERFVAALNSYDGYSDLITGPITFKGSPNTAHGATKMVVLEAQTNERYKMISGGLVDGF